MHPTEIKAFARKVALQDAYGGRSAKVLVKAIKDGQTLWMGWKGFQADKLLARQFDFDADGVAEQIFQVACQTGQLLDVVLVK